MTDDDVLHAREELKIQTVIDLRTPESISREGIGVFAYPTLNRHYVPFLTDEQSKYWFSSEFDVDLAQFYTWLLGRSSDMICHSLALLAQPGVFPAVFHCAAGKDRAGMLAVVVLSLLGVDDEQVIEDYALTQNYMDNIVARMRANSQNRERFDRLPRRLFEAKAETMRKVLDGVNSHYGSMTGFMISRGITPETIGRLKMELLE
jgi:hypothetical protein